MNTPGQNTAGWRRFLSFPAGYEMAQRFMGVPALRHVFVDEYVRPFPGAKVLDLGCGPADIIDAFPEVDYLGVDISPAYIESARRHHGHRGRFEAMSADQLEAEGESFDIIFSFGMLHHIDDETAKRVFRLARTLLKPGGRYVCYDPAFEKGQHPIARLVGILDRGNHVRYSEQYAALARTAFATVQSEVRHGLVWFPVSLHFLIATR